MPKVSVIPRDIRPGDQVERLTRDLDVVWVTVEKVVAQKVKNVTKSYGIHLVVSEADREGLPEDILASRISTWPTYAHYRRFILSPSQRVTVLRTEA